MADAGLRRDAVGLREVLFQSITDMAPGAAIAASIPAGVAFAGGALPLAVVFALIACLFSAWSIGQLARELPYWAARAARTPSSRPRAKPRLLVVMQSLSQLPLRTLLPNRPEMA